VQRLCARIFQTFALADRGNIERGVIDIFEGSVGQKREFGRAPISSIASTIACVRKLPEVSGPTWNERRPFQELSCFPVLPNSALLRQPIHLHLQLSD
jgi:hypothetical protein